LHARAEHGPELFRVADWSWKRNKVGICPAPFVRLVIGDGSCCHRRFNVPSNDLAVPSCSPQGVWAPGCVGWIPWQLRGEWWVVGGIISGVAMARMKVRLVVAQAVAVSSACIGDVCGNVSDDKGGAYG
jgi:hypothetical protein